MLEKASKNHDNQMVTKPQIKNSQKPEADYKKTLITNLIIRIQLKISVERKVAQLSHEFSYKLLSSL
ncbi:hypothetical protein [Methanobrevibacter sp.]